MHEASVVNTHQEHILMLKNTLNDIEKVGASKKRTNSLKKDIKEIDNLFNKCKQKSISENQYELYEKYTTKLHEILSKNAEMQNNDVLHQIEDNITQQNAKQDRAEHEILNETNIVSEKEPLKKQSRFNKEYTPDWLKKRYNKVKETWNKKREQKELESEVRSKFKQMMGMLRPGKTASKKELGKQKILRVYWEYIAI